MSASGPGIAACSIHGPIDSIECAQCKVACQGAPNRHHMTAQDLKDLVPVLRANDVVWFEIRADGVEIRFGVGAGPAVATQTPIAAVVEPQLSPAERAAKWKAEMEAAAREGSPEPTDEELLYWSVPKDPDPVAPPAEPKP